MVCVAFDHDIKDGKLTVSFFFPCEVYARVDCVQSRRKFIGDYVY